MSDGSNVCSEALYWKAGRLLKEGIVEGTGGAAGETFGGNCRAEALC